MSVDVRCPAALPPLPAAVEVAAYRAATEAVTNVARHAGVDRATVEFSVVDGTLTVTVSDAGSSAGPWPPGVGLSACGNGSSRSAATWPSAAAVTVGRYGQWSRCPRGRRAVCEAA